VSGADWWRLAAEQAKLLAEYATGSGLCGGKIFITRYNEYYEFLIE